MGISYKIPNFFSGRNCGQGREAQAAGLSQSCGSVFPARGTNIQTASQLPYDMGKYFFRSIFVRWPKQYIFMGKKVAVGWGSTQRNVVSWRMSLYFCVEKSWCSQNWFCGNSPPLQENFSIHGTVEHNSEDRFSYSSSCVYSSHWKFPYWAYPWTAVSMQPERSCGLETQVLHTPRPHRSGGDGGRALAVWQRVCWHGPPTPALGLVQPSL